MAPRKKTLDSKKIRVLQRIPADLDRLYGPIPDAIEYLQEVYAEHPNATLDEHWEGYENMAMTFSFMREETDEEFEHRLRKEKAERLSLERESRRQLLRKQKMAQMVKLQRELDRL